MSAAAEAVAAMVRRHPTLTYLPPQAEGGMHAATWMTDDGPRTEERATLEELAGCLRAALGPAAAARCLVLAAGRHGVAGTPEAAGLLVAAEAQLRDALPAYCSCCGCLTRYCNCSCCCGKR